MANAPRMISCFLHVCEKGLFHPYCDCSTKRSLQRRNRILPLPLRSPAPSSLPPVTYDAPLPIPIEHDGPNHGCQMVISQILISFVFGPSGFWTIAPLRYAAKFDLFLSLDWALAPSTLAQSKERKGSKFATWQPWGPSLRTLFRFGV